MYAIVKCEPVLGHDTLTSIQYLYILQKSVSSVPVP